MAAMGGIRGAGDGRLYADWLASGGWNPHDPVATPRAHDAYEAEVRRVLAAESDGEATDGPTLPEVPADPGSSVSFTLVDLPCGCQDVHYSDGRIDREHDHVECQPLAQ